MRNGVLALLVMPVMALMAGGIEPANVQPEDKRRANTHPAYKRHHRWGTRIWIGSKGRRFL